MTGEKCPNCGEKFQKLGTHWQWRPSHRPSLTDRQREILIGILMGDGCIPQTRGDRTPHMRISVIQEDFLEWVDDELGVHSCGVSLSRTSEEIAQEKKGGGSWDGCDFSDQYLLITRAHPELEELSEWYCTGQKVFPDYLSLSPIILKMWYVTDGCYTSPDNNKLSECVRITVDNEKENKEKLFSYFEDIGIKAVWNEPKNIKIKNTDRFFNYIGEPVPGFRYKWPEDC